MSVWWRDHADHHMAVLMDPDGPFSSAADADENKSKKGSHCPMSHPRQDCSQTNDFRNNIKLKQRPYIHPMSWMHGRCSAPRNTVSSLEL